MDYRFFDQTLRCDFRLPELPGSRGRPDLLVRSGRGRRWVGGRWHWFRAWQGSSGEPWLKIGKSGGRYLLRFPRQADFLIDADGGTITCYPRPRVSRAAIRHLLLDQVLPLALSHRGRLILHASAVVAPGGAVAFLAAAGTGKSTLAAALGRQGWPVLADDTLRLDDRPDGVHATASYPGLRLWPATLRLLGLPARAGAGTPGSDKRRVAPGVAGFRFRRRPVRLRRLYVLSAAERDGAEVEIRPLSRRAGLVDLVRHAYTLDIDDRQTQARHFERLGRHPFAGTLCHLSVPRGGVHLPAVGEAIAEDLARLRSEELAR